MSAADHLGTYAEGWTNGDADKIIGSASDWYVLDDPNEGHIMPRVAKDAKALEAKISQLRESLPQSALQIFERIYDRHGGQALAPVHRMERAKGPQVWHCGVCNYRVRPQAVVEIANSGSVNVGTVAVPK